MVAGKGVPNCYFSTGGFLLSRGRDNIHELQAKQPKLVCCGEHAENDSSGEKWNPIAFESDVWTLWFQVILQFGRMGVEIGTKKHCAGWFCSGNKESPFWRRNFVRMSVKAQDSAGNKLPINMGKGDYRRSYHFTRRVSVFRSLQMIYPLKILMNLRALEKKSFFFKSSF